MYKLYHNNTYRCPALVPQYDDCCNYYMDRGLHVEGKLFDDVGLVSPIIGDIKMSVRSEDFEGWLVCNGQAVSRATYEALYDLIGDTFGNGDGVTTFNLPDARGRVLGSSNGTYCTGTSVGEYTHTLLVGEMPQHAHGVTDLGHSHTQTSVNDDFNGSGTYPNYTRPSYAQYDSTGSITWTNTINSNTTGISIQNNGSSQPHNNIQPTLFIGNTFIYGGVKNSQTSSNQPCFNTYYVANPCGV